MRPPSWVRAAPSLAAALLSAALALAALALAPAARSQATDCGGHPATIVGTDAGEELIGTAGADVIVGGGGDDRIEGRGGTDVICGEDGRDRLVGGDGSDDLFGGSNPEGTTELLIDGGTDKAVNRLFGGPGSDRLVGGDGDDELDGGPDEKHDGLVGGAGSDKLEGGPGPDTSFGGPGKDSLTEPGGDQSPNRLLGGGRRDQNDQADLIKGGAAQDRIAGRAGDDRVFANGGRDEIKGEDGNDTIFAHSGGDEVFGGDGRDRIEGGAGSDKIEGEADPDLRLSGEGGNDRIDGGAGSDLFIWGGDGNDTLSGGDGDDTMRAHGDTDSCSGGAGKDFCNGGRPGHPTKNTPDDPDTCDKTVERKQSCRKGSAPRGYSGPFSGSSQDIEVTRTWSGSANFERNRDAGCEEAERACYDLVSGTLTWEASTTPGNPTGCTWRAGPTSTTLVAGEGHISIELPDDRPAPRYSGHIAPSRPDSDAARVDGTAACPDEDPVIIPFINVDCCWFTGSNTGSDQEALDGGRRLAGTHTSTTSEGTVTYTWDFASR